MKSPLVPATTTNHPGSVRILLSQTASDALTAAGENAFVIVGKAMRTEEPGTAGRWAVTLAPASMPTATAACNVLMGTHRAVKTKKPAGK